MQSLRQILYAGNSHGRHFYRELTEHWPAEQRNKLIMALRESGLIRIRDKKRKTLSCHR